MQEDRQSNGSPPCHHRHFGPTILWDIQFVATVLHTLVLLLHLLLVYYLARRHLARHTISQELLPFSSFVTKWLFESVTLCCYLLLLRQGVLTSNSSSRLPFRRRLCTSIVCRSVPFWTTRVKLTGGKSHVKRSSRPKATS